ncbi:hypothetical protein [Natrialba hulunbeirensis]|uniref:hypothetical protein n=1 Tax=Natrialba hulunbeirensis TaxID=123783 RepID=UPI0006782159|nr:hypothetical protein [Natrialba hulunbeirensis]
MSSEEATSDGFPYPPYLIRLLPNEAIPQQIVPVGSRPIYYYEWVPVAADNEEQPGDVQSAIDVLLGSGPPELSIEGTQQPIVGDVDRTEDDQLRVNYVRLGESKPPGTYEFTFRLKLDEPLRLYRGDGVKDVWAGQYEYSGSFSVRQVERRGPLPTIEKRITTTKQFVDPDWHCSR